jgi:hypothetical protein
MGAQHHPQTKGAVPEEQVVVVAIRRSGVVLKDAVKGNGWYRIVG